MAAIAIEVPGIYPFESLMSLEVAPPCPAVEGLINEGQNAIFAGYFGVGKTMFAGQLSISLATGRPFVGRAVRRRYKTVFMDFETGPGAIRQRLAKQVEAMHLTEEERAALDENWIYINTLDEKSEFYSWQMDQEGLVKLAKFLNEVGAEVLIADNLGWFVKGELDDPKHVKDFYAILRDLKTACPSLQHGFILMLHHLVKPNGDKTNRCSLLTAPREYLSMARGSQRLLDFAECRLALAEELCGDQIVHIVNGVNRTGVVDVLVMQLRPETLSFDLHEDTQLRYNQAFTGKARRKQVFELLPDEEFTWTEALAIRIGGKAVNKDTLSETLRTARGNGFVVQDPATKKYKKVFRPGAD
jgi:AAA domain